MYVNVIVYSASQLTVLVAIYCYDWRYRSSLPAVFTCFDQALRRKSMYQCWENPLDLELAISMAERYFSRVCVRHIRPWDQWGAELRWYHLYGTAAYLKVDTDVMPALSSFVWPGCVYFDTCDRQQSRVRADCLRTMVVFAVARGVPDWHHCNIFWSWSVDFRSSKQNNLPYLLLGSCASTTCKLCIEIITRTHF